LYGRLFGHMRSSDGNELFIVTTQKHSIFIPESACMKHCRISADAVNKNIQIYMQQMYPVFYDDHVSELDVEQCTTNGSTSCTGYGHNIHPPQ